MLNYMIIKHRNIVKYSQYVIISQNRRVSRERISASAGQLTVRRRRQNLMPSTELLT